MARSSVGRSRSGSKKNNSRLLLQQSAAAGATAQLNSPSLILYLILADLKLSYNPTVGTLGGDAVRAPPKLDVLNAFRKSLVALRTQVDRSVALDVAVMEKIDERVSALREAGAEALEEDEDVDVDVDVDVDDDVDDDDDADDDVDDADDDDDDEDVGRRKAKSKNTKKKRKLDAAGGPPKKIKLQDDDDDDAGDADADGALQGEDEDAQGRRRKKMKTKTETGAAGDELQDEDDIPLSAVRSSGAKVAADEEEELEGSTEVLGVAIQQKEVPADDDDDEMDEQYHTPEGDTRVKNPKSEFVTSQTLPAAAALLGLFSEHTGGLDQTGTQYLKKKYAVASYPTRDLKDMLPGPVPDVDFSKSKPSNQVQFSTFQSYTDVYFRPYSEDDIKFLKEKFVVSAQLGKNYDPMLTPFFIPKLGPLYSDLWAQEEPLNGVKLSTPAAGAQVSADVVLPKGSLDQLTDDLLEMDTVSCGPLVTRLLSALIPDRHDEKEPGALDSDEKPAATTTSSSALEDQQGWNSTIVKTDYSQLEQRLRRELKYVGVYMNVSQTLKDRQLLLTGASNADAGSNASGANADKVKDEFQEDWITGREDDEICAEMRTLQRELAQVNKRNVTRKQTLIPLVEEQIAWQEYMSILEDLDKQIDQAYLKRMRVPKKLKKRGHGSALVGHHQTLTPSLLAAQQLQQLQQAAANSGLKSLLDKRSRWINKIGPLFKPAELMRRMPAESVFKDVDLNKEEEENEELDDGTLGIKSEQGNGEELIEGS